MSGHSDGFHLNGKTWAPFLGMGTFLNRILSVPVLLPLSSLVIQVTKYHVEGGGAVSEFDIFPPYHFKGNTAQKN